MSTPDIAEAVAELLGQPVASVEPVGGGRNSRVYRIDCLSSDRYIAKFYPAAGPGQRNRLDAEYTGLGLLWENGFRCVPRPMAAHPQGSCAIYEYIEGAGVPDSDVTTEHISQAVEFLARLKELGDTGSSREVGAAAEACFSVQAIFDSIDLRLNRLLSVEDQSPQGVALHRFLRDELNPVLADVRHRTAAEMGGTVSSEISPEERTLSPSDFGFHNALRRPNGELVFLDFEYFGWDDPAKMISDFILHPAMDLTDSHKTQFLSGTLKSFSGHPGLKSRLKRVLPLFALKWTTILLNEFVPERLERRNFTGNKPVDVVQVQDAQLVKARTMLGKATVSYDTSI